MVFEQHIERAEGELSAVQEVEQRHQIKVISIITLENLIEYLEKIPSMSENLDKIRQHREAYGVIDN